MSMSCRFRNVFVHRIVLHFNDWCDLTTIARQLAKMTAVMMV